MEELKNMNLLAQFIFSEKLISQLENFFNDQIYFMDSFVIQKNNRTFKKKNFIKTREKNINLDFYQKVQIFMEKLAFHCKIMLKGLVVELIILDHYHLIIFLTKID